MLICCNSGLAAFHINDAEHRGFDIVLCKKQSRKNQKIDHREERKLNILN